MRSGPACINDRTSHIGKLDKGVGVTNLPLRKGARVASLPLSPVMAFIDTSDTILGTEIVQIHARYIEPDQPVEVAFKMLPVKSIAGVWRPSSRLLPPGK